MDIARCRKREFIRIWKERRNEEDRKKYCEAKKDVKRVAYGYGSESSRGGGED